MLIEELDVFDQGDNDDSNKKNYYVSKRKKRINNHQNKNYKDESYEQKLAIPAFKRKNIILEDEEESDLDNTKTLDFTEED